MSRKSFEKTIPVMSESKEVTKKMFTKKTPMGEESRKKIFEGALRLFSTKPYELVTVADLEKATGKSRGAIFYHIKDMRELFEIVIERYIIDVQDINKILSKKKISIEDITLLEFINIYISAQEENINKMYAIARVDRNAKVKVEPFYLSLILSSGHYFDGYNEKMENNFKMDKGIWSFVIQKAIEKGEVKSGMDAILCGDMFSTIFYGKTFVESLGKGINTNEVKEIFMKIYNQIKV